MSETRSRTVAADPKKKSRRKVGRQNMLCEDVDVHAVLHALCGFGEDEGVLIMWGKDIFALFSL